MADVVNKRDNFATLQQGPVDHNQAAGMYLRDLAKQQEEEVKAKLEAAEKEAVAKAEADMKDKGLPATGQEPAPHITPLPTEPVEEHPSAVEMPPPNPDDII